MPSIELCAGWMVQVERIELAAHLEAYVELQPTINTFRLCHRFGSTGPLSRLPVELVMRVEQYLIAEQRQARLEDLLKGQRCVKDRCKIPHHCCEDELLHSWTTMLAEGGDLASTHVYSEAERSRRSTGKLVLDSSAAAYFTIHEKIFRQHFGLQIWQSCMNHKEWDTRDMLACHDDHSPTVYLMLCADYAESVTWELCDEVKDYELGKVLKAGLALPFPPSPPQQTERSLGRFSRAMTILGLGAAAVSTSDNNEKCGETVFASVIPQLRLMARHIVDNLH